VNLTSSGDRPPPLQSGLSCRPLEAVARGRCCRSRNRRDHLPAKDPHSRRDRAQDERDRFVFRPDPPTGPDGILRPDAIFWAPP
jgi:hypothetical protein